MATQTGSIDFKATGGFKSYAQGQYTTIEQFNTVGGRNLLRYDVKHVGWGSNAVYISSNVRGMYCAVEEGKTYTVSRRFIEGNRFGIYSVASEPIVHGLPATQLHAGTSIDTLSETVTIPTGGNWLLIYLSNASEDISDGNIKVELGSVATPWTMAPEDAVTRFASVQTAIEQNSETIALKANSSDVYTKTESDGLISTEVTNRNAAITESANSITLSVSQQYVTNQRFDDLKIGGRNLIPSSVFTSVGIDGSTRELGPVSLATMHSNFNKDEKYVWNEFEPETQYTFRVGALATNPAAHESTKTGPSFTLRYTDGTSNSVSFPYGVDSIQYKTMTSPAGKTVERLTSSYSNSGTTWTFYEIKLEEGNRATDWTPAPEDIETRMTSAETSISQNAEAITLRATREELEAVSDSIPGSLSELTNDLSMAWQGVSSTAASTNEKAVTCAGFSLVAGATVTVRFSTASTASAPTLNVNNTGAKAIVVAGSVTSSTNQLLWAANAMITFNYDGTYWRVTSEPRAWYSTCATAAATAAKAATVNEAVICKGTTVNLQMTYENAVANPTLNVTSLGAKAIYVAGVRPTATSENNWTASSTVQFVFDGQYFRYDSDASTKAKSVSDTAYNKLQSRGEQLIVNGNGFMGNNTNFSWWTFDGSMANGSPGSFTHSPLAISPVATDEMFPVDTAKAYRVEFDTYSKGDGAAPQLYAMLLFYDVDKQLMNIQQVSYIEGSTTTLAQDLKNGDTTVYLTSAAGFADTSQAHQRALIFWDYTNSFGYTYPPETYSRDFVYTSAGLWSDNSKVDKVNNTITLSSPWSSGTRTAGTPVSQNSSGSTYVYFWSKTGSSFPIDQWVHASGTYSGFQTGIANVAGKFYKGTAYCRVGWLWNYQNSTSNPQKQIWITNVTVQEDVASKDYADSAASNAQSAAISVANTAIDAAVSNISIGGRNYVLGTSGEKSWSTKSDGYYLSESLNTLNTTDPVSLNFDIKSTMSQWVDAYYRSAESGGTAYNNDSNPYPAIHLVQPDTWYHVSWSGNAGINVADAKYLCIRSNSGEHSGSTTKGTVTVRNMKLEKGNKPTEWSPAPEDVDVAISTAEQNAIDAIPDNLSEFANDLSMAWQGTSSTAASTAAKVVDCAGFKLVAGATVTVRFSTANTSATPTLNVNSTGAKAIWVGGAVTSSTNQLIWAANAMLTFTYDGTQWRVTSEPRTWYSTCATAAATAAKTATINEVVLCKGTTVSLQMTYANSVADPTLNIGSLGAKAIYAGNVRPTATSENNWTAASTVAFVFDGAYFRYDSDSAAKAKAASAEAVDNLVIGGRNLLPLSQLRQYAGGTLENNAYYSVNGSYIVARNQPNNSKLPGWKVSMAEGDTYTVSGTVTENTTDAGLVHIYARGFNASGTALYSQQSTSAAIDANGNFSKELPSSWSASGISYANLGIGILTGVDYTLRVKLEKGSKATDWTPAPEDVDAAILTAIDDVSIGGRNLLRFTGSPNYAGMNYTSRLSTDTTGWYFWANAGTMARTDSGMKITCNGTTSTGIVIPLAYESAVVAGEDYILSFDYRTNTTGWGGLYLLYHSGGNAAITTGWSPTTASETEWAHFSTHVRWTGTNTVDTYAIMFPYSNTNGAWYEIRDGSLKLERGSKATDWTPAPEDMATQASLNAARSWYATCDTAAATAAKVATVDPETTGFVLSKGTTVNVAFTNTNSAAVANLTLNVNSTGAKAIKYIYNNTIANLPAVSYLLAGAMYQFVYDGTYWMCQSMNYNTNTNTYDRRLHNNYVLAAGAVVSGAIACGTATGYRQVAAGIQFDLAYPLLWAGGAWTAGSQYANAYEAYPSANPSTTGAVEGLAINKIVWLKGQVAGTTFTCAATNFLTCVVPEMPDEYFYIPLGIVANDATTKMYFSTSDKLYAFLDGAFQRVDLSATTRITSAEAEIDLLPDTIVAHADRVYATKTEVPLKASGSNTSVLADGAAPVPLDSLTIYGESVQDGTPAPNAPVPIVSVGPANLLDCSGIGSTSSNGITWTANGDGTFNAVGTASANSTLSLGTFFFDSNVSYVVDGCPSGGGTTSHEIMVQLTSAANSGGWQHDYGTGVEFVGVGEERAMQLVVRSGKTVSMTFKPQVRYAVTPNSTFAPYGSIGVNVRGKNMVDIARKTNGYVSSSNGAVVASTTWSYIPCIPANGNTTYTFNPNSSADAGGLAGIGCYDKNMTFIGSFSSGLCTFTTPEDTRYIQPTFRNSDSSDIQLELGSEATEYEPYVSTTALIPMQGYELRSLPDGTRDELTISPDGHVTMTQRVGVSERTTVDGVNSVTGGFKGNWNLPDGIDNATAGSVTCMCDKLESYQQTDTTFVAKDNVVKVCRTSATSTPMKAFIHFTSNMTNTEQFNSRLSEIGGVTVTYPLAEAQVIDLGTIDMPELMSRCTIEVVAALTPTIDATWWNARGREVWEESARLRSQIQIAADGIRSEVSETYVANDDLKDYIKQSVLTQTAEGIRGEIATAQSDASDALSQIGTLTTFAEVVQEGNESVLRLGSSASPITGRFSNEKLSFLYKEEGTEASEEVAYIAGSNGVGELHVTTAVVETEMKFGQWAWFVRKNGNLALRWAGGE